ncbi:MULTISPECIES: hypothetical protein [unclassified Thiocapsa]|uniref:hypothetical protein n=1 Tax=unclassified Thiocapsa TaxID=2641286 RepID=UPI0035B40512
MTDTAEPTPRSDHDSPGKESLEGYFPEFLALLFPRIHAGIDWCLGQSRLRAQDHLEAVPRHRLDDPIARNPGNGLPPRDLHRQGEQTDAVRYHCV